MAKQCAAASGVRATAVLQPRKLMKNATRSLKIEILLIVSCLSLLGCSTDSTKVPSDNKADHVVKKNNAMKAITHHENIVSLHVEKPFKLVENSPITITLESVFPDYFPAAAYFRVEDSEDGSTRTGWCHAGEYMHFSPAFGRVGVKLLRVRDASVDLEFNF